MDAPAKKKHTLEDHLTGADALHSHDEDSDHEHDHDDLGEYDPQGDALWLQDHISLLSVGIDIGSSGTQVIFSRVEMRRLSEDLSSRYYVVGRETIFQSPVSLTPYQSEERIDDRGVGEIIDAAYQGAGIHPDEIDTGAVILTGEALRRENAEALADVIADMGGEFVCATAGHHMESLLAAYGSGAAKTSHDLKQPVLNIDIGGGTTKLALVEDGKVVHTGAIHIGGRLAVVDDDGRLTRLDPAGRQLAKNAGLEWELGEKVTDAEMDRVAAWMADAIVEALSETPSSPAVEALWLTDPLEPVDGIAGVMFSGGVAEYVYAREKRDFYDLGRRLGKAIRSRIQAGAFPHALLPAGECIRATAIGASEYSVQLSGNTVYISNPAELLPRKNLQVLQPDVALGETIEAARVTQAIRRHFEAFDLAEGSADVALAFRWQGPPAYARLAALGQGILEALPNTLLNGRPIYLILDGDVAQTLGALLKDEWRIASEVLVLDGISLWDFDYVDLGRVRMPSYTVPVTIKSLLFTQGSPTGWGGSTSPRGPGMRGHRGHGHAHDHAHGQGPGHHHHHHHRKKDAA
jgi:ethanolamine utilization protein EutA